MASVLTITLYLNFFVNSMSTPLTISGHWAAFRSSVFVFF